MRLKLISIGAGIVGLCLAVVPVRAEQLTIAQFSQVFGDILAISVICPDLDGNKDAIDAFMKSSGVTKKLMEDQTGYWDDVQAAKKASFVKRKAMSVDGNCADALSLYGDNGTVIKGLLFPKTAAQSSK